MGKQWLARVAGIIDEMVGCTASVGAIVFAVNTLGKTVKMPGFDIFIIIFVVLPLFIFGILAIIGGAFNLVVKKWGLALAGSISALIVVAFLSVATTGMDIHPMLGLLAICLGIIAIVFTCISRKAFK
jgi:peptidoglycan/LPS O-acetylase OafA/YrhL